MNFEEAQRGIKDLTERRYGSEITRRCQVLFSHGPDCKMLAGMVINPLLHNLDLVTASCKIWWFRGKVWREGAAEQVARKVGSCGCLVTCKVVPPCKFIFWTEGFPRRRKQLF